jgi:hypothetical protein
MKRGRRQADAEGCNESIVFTTSVQHPEPCDMIMTSPLDHRQIGVCQGLPRPSKCGALIPRGVHVTPNDYDARSDVEGNLLKGSDQT